jgi:hypothetical protein
MEDAALGLVEENICVVNGIQTAFSERGYVCSLISLSRLNPTRATAVYRPHGGAMLSFSHLLS